MKNILLFFSFFFICQISFAQNISTASASQDTSGVTSNNVSIYLSAGTYGDSIVHVVWENYDEQNIKEVIIESSNDGIDYAFLSKAIPSTLLDIHVYNYPPEWNYYNTILKSSEHGGMRYFYNDIVKYRNIRQNPKWYRIKMIAFSNQVYLSQPENTIRKKSSDIIAQMQAESGDRTTMSKRPETDEKSNCQSVGTIPSGYTASSTTQTHYGTCCYYVETLCNITGPVQTNCGGNSYAWCCDTAVVNTNQVCASGYASDPCCAHTCVQYAICTCSGNGVPAIWQCCSTNITTTWVVTQSVNYSPISISHTTTNETCAGDHNGALSVTPSNGTAPYTYAWSTGATTSSISSLSAGSYTVTVTDTHGCTVTGSFTVIANALPVANAGTDKTICSGQSTVLTASGGSSYHWSTGANTASVSVSPTTSTTYVVTVTNASGCTATDNVFVTVNALPTANAGADQSICTGGSASLTASAGSNYVWSSGQNTATITVTPATTSTYTVTVTGSNGCSASDNVTITVNSIPVASAGNDQTICNGVTASLTATGGSTYLWSTGATTSTISVTPTYTTSYSVTATSGAGCSATDVVTVNVNATPTANAGTDQIICSGLSATLTATGGNSYQWSNGGNTASITVTPATTTSYIVTVTNTQGCTAADAVTVNVNSLPSASAGADQTICIGVTATLTATGGANYLWNTGAGTSNLVVSPASTTTYTVTVTGTNGCSASDNAVVNVNPNPTASAGVDQTICQGQSASLTASGGSTYHWNTGASTVSIVVSPSSNTTYTVTVTGNNGCTATDIALVTVNATPVANAGSDATICLGQSASLTASGGSSFQWNTGATTSSITVSPTTTTSYTVTVSNVTGCNSTDNVTVNVNSLPAANAGPDKMICQGQSTTLTASGGGSYFWNTGSVSSSIIVSPGATTTYSVTVTGSAGCTATDNATVYINALPVADAGSSQAICLGQSAVLQASGGATYLWNTGATSVSINVTPATSTAYTVTVTSGNGCSASDNVTVTVNALPIAYASADQTICVGNSTIITASGGSSYTWNTGDVTASVTVSPSVTTTYVVTATGSNGCTASDNVTVNVNSLPLASAGTGQTICQGQSSTLTATGGTSYHWNTGALTASINVTPSSTTTYTVTATTSGCSASDNVTVAVNALPTAYAGADQTICMGQTAILTATGDTIFHWINGANTATTSVSPNSTTTYIVTVTSGNGCTTSDNVVVTVNALPVANAGADQTICFGQSSTLIATSAASYIWSTGANTSSITVSPSSSTTYSLTVTNANGCTASDNVQVTVNSLPIPNAGMDQTICRGQTATLTATGGGTYHWSTGATTASINVSPISTTTYTITVSNSSGCSATDQTVITVNPLPAANAGADQTVCFLQSVTLTATGGGTYSWNTGGHNDTIHITPTASTTYSVTVANAFGCQATDAVSITVNTAAIANAGQDQYICPGQTAVLTSATTGSYLWSNGMTTQSVSVSPVTTTTYTLTVSAGGCSSSDEVVVNVAALISVNAGADQTICRGQAATLTASGGSNYTWSNGSTNSSINVSPIATTTYTVTTTSGSCSGTDNIVVTVNPLPVADAGPNQTICDGTSTIITATGGTSFLWSNGSVSSSQSVSPSLTTPYYVTVTNVNGCTASDLVTINVNSVPAANAGPDLTICQGHSTTITATGGGSYSWSSGPTTASITVTPLSTTTYIVTVSSSGCSATDDALVTVLGVPVADAGNDQIICYGQTAILTATGGGSYQWNTGSVNGTVNVAPTTLTTYTVTVTNSNGCTASDNVQVNVNPQSFANAGPDQTMCQGLPATLTASGGSSYLWSNSNNTASFTVSLFTTTLFTVTVTNSNGCTDVDNVTININAVPATNAGVDKTICNGQTVTLTASGGATYHWNTGATTSSLTVTPSSTTTYTVTATNANGCTASDNVVVFVNPLPVANAGIDQTICQGSTATLIASAGSSYSWNTGQTLATITVTPAINTTYTVTVTSSNGCSASDNVFVSVTAVPVANAGSNQSICNGNSVTLTATGGTTYLWSSGDATGSISVTPSSTTTYTVTATSSGCSASDKVTITVNPTPVAEAGNNQTICNGQSVTLTATGGSTYHWSTGATTSSISVTPSTTTNYIVTATNASGCTAADNVTVTVFALPAANAGADQTICVGQTATITASGGASYLWNTAAVTSSISVTPASSTTYSVTVTGSNGCSTSDNIAVFVNTNPTANAGTDQVICQGQSASLIATGGSVYQWSSGASTASTIVAPTSTTTYTVTVTASNGCTATDAALVTVNPTPAANGGSDVTICAGQSALLSASGGSSYQWNTGPTTASITVIPGSTTTYTVTVSNALGCSASDNVIVHVNALPVANAGTDQNLCLGNSASISASGGGTYFWNTGSASNPIIVAPTSNTTYTVTVTGVNGCKATDDITVYVNGVPVANAGNNQTVCEGQTVVLQGSGGASYQWNTGDVTSSINVSPAITTTYTVTVTNGSGCSASDNVTVFVNAMPVAYASADQTICSGNSTILMASGGSTYHWNTGANVASINVSPIVTTTYNVTVTGLNGCSATDFVTVFVNNLPSASAGPNQIICNGQSTTLTATGGTSYLWSTGDASDALAVSPSSTTTYSVTVTDNGCSASDNTTITVNNVPAAYAGPGQTICVGQSVTLTASGGTTYSWSNGGNTASINVSPAQTTTYTVTVANASGCTASDNAIVTANPLPAAYAGPDMTICYGQSASLEASGGLSYLWNNGVNTAAMSVTPLITTTYTVTVTDINGCSASDKIIVTVNVVIAANAGVDQTICTGQSAILTATGGGTYVWNSGAVTASVNVTPSTTTTYSVTVTNVDGCVTSDKVIVFVNSLPPANAGLDHAICLGHAATLTASGGTTYLWNTGDQNATINVSPSVTSTYTVTVSNNSGCSASDNVQVTVNSLPVASAGPDQTICQGQSSTLTASGGSSYVWNSGGSGISIVVSPASTSTYTVTVSNNNGCTASDEAVVSVASYLTADAGPNQSICAGQTVTLSASGGSNYIWNNGATLYYINVSPLTTTVYTVTASSGSCSATDNVTVTVNSSPFADAGSDQTICSGTTTLITAVGGVSYLWNDGATTSSQSVSPTTTTIYLVTATNANGCTASDYVTISVNSVPVANAGPDTTICQGQSTNLLASGGTGYSWSSGQTTASATVTPIITTTYTVTVASNGCSASDDAVVNVLSIPIANAGIDHTICLGQTATLTASGGGTYQWNNGPVSSAINVSPTVPSTTYSVTVTAGNGCTSSDDAVVNVNPLPPANAGPDQTLCNGMSTTLVATGGTSYIWNNGNNSSTLTIFPVSTVTYTVTVGDLNGCSASDNVTVNVNPIPLANAGNDHTICSGQSVMLIASGGGTYLWSDSSHTASINVSPATTTSYTVTVTGANGCTASDMVNVFVNPLPPANAGADQTICQGSSTTLTATGGSLYVWNTGQGLQSITVSPAQTTTYSVTVTGNNGCSTTDNIIVNVNPLPVANAGIDQTICASSPATLTATGGTTYVWSTGDGTSSIVVSPLSTSTYSVTVTSSNGCSATDQVTVNVIALPVVNVSPDQTICNGQSAALTVSGGTFYQWTTGQTITTINVAPAVTTTYTVTVTNSSGCSASDNIVITVNPLPVPEAGPDQTICLGQVATLAASGGSSYVWNTGSVNPTILVSPTSTATYSVTVSNNMGCSAADLVHVFVLPNPTASVLPTAPTICLGGNVQLTASGANTYSWSPSTGLSSSTGASVNASPTATTNYTVTATDLNGCSASTSVVVTIGTSLVISVTPNSASICPGSSVQLTASGANSFTWSPSTGLSSASGATVIASPASTTTYTVTGTDGLGCYGTTTVNVNLNIINATVASTAENCGQANGILTITPMGTCTQGFGFVWSTSPQQITQTVTNVAAGIYTVTVSCGACSITAIDTVAEILGPTLAIDTIINTSCGMVDGGATVAATGGTPPYSYLWSNAQNTPVLINVTAGNYTVTVHDAVGCTAAVNVAIGQSSLIIANTTSTNADCNVSNGTANVNVIQGNGNYTYIWSTNPVQTTATVNGLAAGTYYITISDNLCTITDTVVVLSNPGPTADFTAHPNVMDIDNNLAFFTDHSIGNHILWQWSFGDGTVWSTEQFPSHIFDNPGTYNVTLIVTDINGCADTISYPVTVNDIFTFYIPNAFTPNGDGLNDIWLPKGVNVDPDNYEMYIYTRWGTIVCETRDLNEGWNGTFMNRGNPAKDAVMDVYVYRINLKEINGKDHIYIGQVNLVR